VVATIVIAEAIAAEVAAFQITSRLGTATEEMAAAVTVGSHAGNGTAGTATGTAAATEDSLATGTVETDTSAENKKHQKRGRSLRLPPGLRIRRKEGRLQPNQVFLVVLSQSILLRRKRRWKRSFLRRRRRKNWL